VSKTFPTVGIIADGLMIGMFKSPANSLGIELLSFDAKDVGHSNIQECDVVTIADQSNSLIIAKKLEADGIMVRPSFSAISAASDKFNSVVDQVVRFV